MNSIFQCFRCFKNDFVIIIITDYPQDADSDLIALLKGILTKYPKQRIAIAQIWESEWLNGFEKRVKSTISFVPIGAQYNIITRKNSIRYASNLIGQ